jgi:hypothetical protein
MIRVFTLNGKGMMEFKFVFPMDGMWTFESKLAGDLGVSAGDVIAFSDNTGDPDINMEVVNYGSPGGRTTVLAMPVGYSKLSAICRPTFLQNPSCDNLLSSVYGGQAEFLSTKPEFGDNLTVPGTLTGWKAIKRYIDQNARFSRSGVLQIGDPAASDVSSRFAFMDYNATSNLLQIGIVDDMWIDVGQTIFGSVVQSAMYEFNEEGLRITLEVNGEPAINSK